MAKETGTVTGYINLLLALEDFVSSNHVATAAVNAGGSGYAVDDILTAAGGTSTTAATFKVTGVSSGAVTSVKIIQSGAYTANPSTPNSVTGGSGTGCTLDLTFAATGWTVNRSAVYDSPERELQLEGSGSGSDEIYVGIRTYQQTGPGAFSWELAGFSGYDSGLDFVDQPGVSPGRFDDNLGGAFVPLTDQSLDYWFFANSRRIIVVAKIGSAYVNAYLGYMNPFATDTEYPVPLVIIGCSSDEDTLPGSNDIGFSGMTDPIAHSMTSTIRGPGLVRYVDGAWYDVTNSQQDGSTRVVPTDRVSVLPAGSTNAPDSDRQDWYNTDLISWASIIPRTGNPGNPTNILKPTPNTGGDIRPLFPATLYMREPVTQLLGELDEVYWFSADGGIVSEDTLDNEDYVVFQNCNRTELFTYFAVRDE